MNSKYILSIGIMALLSIVLLSCNNDYPETWGFEVGDKGDFQFVPTNVTPSGYDATLQTTLRIVNEGDGITEGGFRVVDGDNATEYPGTIQRTGNDAIVKANVTGLQLEKNYMVYPYVKNGDVTLYIKRMSAPYSMRVTSKGI